MSDKQNNSDWLPAQECSSVELRQGSMWPEHALAIKTWQAKDLISVAKCELVLFHQLLETGYLVLCNNVHCRCLKTQHNASQSHTDQKHLPPCICDYIQHPSSKTALLETASFAKQWRPFTLSALFTIPSPVCLPEMCPTVSWRSTDIRVNDIHMLCLWT